MHHEMTMAHRVQQGLLSVDLPKIDGIQIARKCVPAENVGGDFYGFVAVNVDRLVPTAAQSGVISYSDQRESYLGVGIGDVAGHGVSAGLVMALASGLMLELARTVAVPNRVLTELNARLCQYIAHSEIPYVTAFYGQIDLSTLQLSYASGGHPMPLLIRNNSVEFIDSDGIFLGMFMDEVYELSTVQLARGDRLVLMTDGILDAGNHTDPYGINRVIALVMDRSRSPEAVVDRVLTSIREFSGKAYPADDQSLVIIDL